MALTQITTGGLDDDINIASNTLKVDGTNNRVGIGTGAFKLRLQEQDLRLETVHCLGMTALMTCSLTTESQLILRYLITDQSDSESTALAIWALERTLLTQGFTLKRLSMWLTAQIML